LVRGTQAAAKDLSQAAYAPFCSFEKLQRPLISITGAAGSLALISRALVLAKAEFPRLNGVTLDKKGSIEGLEHVMPPLSREEAEEGEVLLIGNTIELLCTFLGEAMALRLIQGQWPDASFASEESGKERNA
jgi:hypothetical protein